MRRICCFFGFHRWRGFFLKAHSKKFALFFFCHDCGKMSVK